VAGQVAVAALRNYTERDVLVMERLAALLALAIQQQRACRKLCEAQAQLVQSAKMAAVGQLAAGIAHEINNPMAVISTSAETLQAFLASRPGAKETLGPLWVSIAEQIENIDASVFRCKAIIDSLLDFSRAEALEDTDVAPLLAHALRLIRASKQGRERALALKVSGQTVFVWNGTGARDADPVAAACLPLKTSRHQLQQVVLNLVANAVDATTPGGSVTVDAGRRGNGVEITVADNGRGIAPEHRAHLFEPFFTTKPVGRGTGLGLYLSHRIVSALGGTIECESEAGRGTKMKVWLPAAALEV
jgi:signal transduction histidine kinase